MDKLAKEIEMLFSKGVLSQAKDLNLNKSFTDQQAELLENVVVRLLGMEGERSEQLRYVSGLNLETSLLLCTWFIRGGQLLYRDRLFCK